MLSRATRCWGRTSVGRRSTACSLPWRPGGGRLQLLPERQRGYGVDHLPPLIDPPHPILLGNGIVHRAIAAVFEPVVDGLAVLAIPDPLPECIHPSTSNLRRRARYLVDGDGFGISELIEHVLQLAFLGRAVGIDDVPERWRPRRRRLSFCPPPAPHTEMSSTWGFLLRQCASQFAPLQSPPPIGEEDWRKRHVAPVCASFSAEMVVEGRCMSGRRSRDKGARAPSCGRCRRQGFTDTARVPLSDAAGVVSLAMS